MGNWFNTPPPVGDTKAFIDKQNAAMGITKAMAGKEGGDGNRQFVPSSPPPIKPAFGGGFGQLRGNTGKPSKTRWPISQAHIAGKQATQQFFKRANAIRAGKPAPPQHPIGQIPKKGAVRTSRWGTSQAHIDGKLETQRFFERANAIRATQMKQREASHGTRMAKITSILKKKRAQQIPELGGAAVGASTPSRVGGAPRSYWTGEEVHS